MMNEEKLESKTQNDNYDDYCDTIYLDEGNEEEWEIPMQKSSAGSVTSLVLGIIGSVAWLMPIIAIPVNVVGIVLGAINMKSNRHKGIAI